MQEYNPLLKHGIQKVTNITTDGTFTSPSNSNVPSSLAVYDYVQTFLAGQHFHAACRLGTTANLTALYNNGVSGVGATLTNSGALAALSIDGVSVALNDRILVKDQSAQLQNGIYKVTAIGSGVIAWVLTRATDFDTSAEIGGGDTVNILTGTVNSLRQYIQTNPSVVVGVSSIVWAQSGSATWGNITGTLSAQTDLQTALNAKENTIVAGLATDYFRGDKTFQVLNKAAVGLGNVDNTSDLNKPISTATQNALNGKEPTITAGTTAQYWRGDKTFQPFPPGFVLADGEGTTASGSGVNLGGGNRFTSSRIIKGDLLNTLDLDIQEFRFFRGINTFFNFIGINGSFLGSNTGFTHISGGLGIKIGTQKVNNLTVANNGYLRNSDTSGTAEWIDAPIKKIGNQTGIGTTYTGITGLTYALAANTTYRICGTIFWQSTATNNGIGFSYLAMAGLVIDKMSVAILDDPTTPQFRNGTSAGAGSHTVTTTSATPANTTYKATFQMDIVVGASPVTFQPSVRSEGQGGATVSVMGGSFMTIETI